MIKPQIHHKCFGQCSLVIIRISDLLELQAYTERLLPDERGGATGRFIYTSGQCLSQPVELHRKMPHNIVLNTAQSNKMLFWGARNNALSFEMWHDLWSKVKMFYSHLLLWIYVFFTLKKTGFKILLADNLYCCFPPVVRKWSWTRQFLTQTQNSCSNRLTDPD